MGEGIIKLYHGTDIESALDILNNGLNGDRLLALQTQPLQLGQGWYAGLNPEVAWFFAALSPGLEALGCTVIEISLPVVELNNLLDRGEAKIEPIANVMFATQQIWFSINAFKFLNEKADFQPYQEAG
ncbi:hypothetical protein QUA35_21670 [Microcoleus sp. N9_B2]|uniref:hypothetical protein n=1 Tax=unclassified Microcoleus TaxID=2642155 RepID=UPI002FCEF7FD